MIGDGIHEDALRYLVQQHAVREVVVGRNQWRPSVGPIDPPGWPGRAPGAGALAARSDPHLGQPDCRGKFADTQGLKGFTVEL